MTLCSRKTKCKASKAFGVSVSRVPFSFYIALVGR